jgi:sarcosine oxidase delta subunit
MRAIFCPLGLVLGLYANPARAEDAGYPTATRAEYVFACMATNGGTREALQHCSCAIDVVASVLPYEQYEKAETVLRMRRSAGGYLAEEFRAAGANAIVRDLEEAEAEAEVRCF